MKRPKRLCLKLAPNFTVIIHWKECFSMRRCKTLQHIYTKHLENEKPIVLTTSHCTKTIMKQAHTHLYTLISLDAPINKLIMNLLKKIRHYSLRTKLVNLCPNGHTTSNSCCSPTNTETVLKKQKTCDTIGLSPSLL